MCAFMRVPRSPAAMAARRDEVRLEERKIDDGQRRGEGGAVGKGGRVRRRKARKERKRGSSKNREGEKRNRCFPSFISPCVTLII